MSTPLLSPVLALLLVAFAVGAAACGSDDSGTSPEATATTETGGLGTPPPPAATAADTSTPEPDTATPAPTDTSTPVPAPTPVVLTFTAEDSANGTKTPCSCGPLGIVYADATFGRPVPNRLQATAFVNIGVNEHPSASAWLINNFRATGEGGSVTAQVSTDVSWRGVLAGTGAGGTGAAVTIRLAVMDGTATVASTVVHTREIRESALSIGGLDDIGSTPVDLTAVLVRGRLYELRLTVSCEATSGLIGAAAHCVFGPSDLYNDGYVDWGSRTIVFAD